MRSILQISGDDPVSLFTLTRVVAVYHTILSMVLQLPMAEARTMIALNIFGVVEYY